MTNSQVKALARTTVSDLAGYESDNPNTILANVLRGRTITYRQEAIFIGHDFTDVEIANVRASIVF